MSRVIGDAFIRYTTLEAVEGPNQQTIFLEADELPLLLARILSTLSQIPDLTPPWRLTHFDLGGGGHGTKYVAKMELGRSQEGIVILNGGTMPMFANLFPRGVQASDAQELLVHRTTVQAELAALFAATPAVVTPDTWLVGAALGHKYSWMNLIVEFTG